MYLILIHMKSSSTYSFMFSFFAWALCCCRGLCCFFIFITLCVQSIQSCPIFVTSWTVAHKAHLSMGFSRQEYWNGFPYLPPGDLPNCQIEPMSACISCLTSGFFTHWAAGKPFITIHTSMIYVSIIPLIVIELFTVFSYY